VANVGGEYQITNNFGIGLSFEYFDIEVDAVKGGFKGNASLETSKALIYLTGRF
jgi:outer membrane protein W